MRSPRGRHTIHGGGGTPHCLLRCLPDSAPSRPLLQPLISVIPALLVELARRVHDRASIAVSCVEIVPGRPGRGEHDWRIGHDAKLGQQNRRVKQNVQKMQKKGVNWLFHRKKLQIVVQTRAAAHPTDFDVDAPILRRGAKKRAR
jgi:hypothetical protein